MKSEREAGRRQRLSNYLFQINVFPKHLRFAIKKLIPSNCSTKRKIYLLGQIPWIDLESVVFKQCGSIVSRL
jgi:hypothetical protein